MVRLSPPTAVCALAFLLVITSLQTAVNAMSPADVVGGVSTTRSSNQYRAVTWQKTWSTSATRTIRLVVVGTSGRPRVDVDAFVVVK